MLTRLGQFPAPASQKFLDPCVVYTPTWSNQILHGGHKLVKESLLGSTTPLVLSPKICSTNAVVRSINLFWLLYYKL